jgi:hypothetical protein
MRPGDKQSGPEVMMMRRFAVNLPLSVASVFVLLACGSETARQPLGTPTTIVSSTEVGPDVTRGVGPRPGETTTAAAPTTSTPGEDAAHTQEFLTQVAPILTAAQQQIYSLQGPFTTFVPDTFPAPEWARFYDDEASVARDALQQLRAIAPTAPDPDAFLAALAAWESGMVRRLDDLAAAARLSDGGQQFTAVHDRDLPGGDPLREYMLVLEANLVPPYMGPVIIMFGPDAGR